MREERVIGDDDGGDYSDVWERERVGGGVEEIVEVEVEVEERKREKKKKLHFPFDFHSSLVIASFLLSSLKRTKTRLRKNHGHSPARPLLGIRIGTRVEGDDSARGEKAGERG